MLFWRLGCIFRRAVILFGSRKAETRKTFSIPFILMWSSVRWNVITVGFVCALHSVSLLLHLPCLLVCRSSNSWAHMWNLCNHPGSVAGMRNVMERISCLRCAVQLPAITQCTARQCFPLHMMSPPFPLIFPVNRVNYNSVSYVKSWYWKVQAWSGFRSLSKCKLLLLAAQ